MKFILLLIGCTFIFPGAQAQSFCASEGQPSPTALVERFINADCEACWGRLPAMTAHPQALTLDWIVPSSQGDEAPLSAAARREAQERLDALKIRAPHEVHISHIPVGASPSLALRVGHGVPVGGYLGASIELKISPGTKMTGELNALLVLIETIPAGVDGTPIERNLVRNVLTSRWDILEQLSNSEQQVWREMRPLSIPAGTTPERLRVVGWVQDDRGRVMAAAQSVCLPTQP